MDEVDGYGKRALVVDDDDDARLLLSMLLDHAGYNVVPACDGLAALNELNKRHFDIVITDYSMPLLNGGQLVRHIRALQPGLPVILLSGYLPDEERESDCQPFAFVRKPYDNGHLLDLIQSASDSSGVVRLKRSDDGIFFNEVHVD